VEEFGEIEVLVANAGVADYEPFSEMSLETVERMTGINWLGTVYTVHAALPGMLARGRGHIVVMSSAAGLRSFPGAAVYGATKSAQKGFAEALRHELADTGISLTTVFPGETDTHLHDHERDRMPAWAHPDGRAPVEPLVRRIVRAVERDERFVYYPRLMGALRLMWGGLGDSILRRIRGETIAPRRG
jgi:short-subunit dehydrogenase